MDSSVGVEYGVLSRGETLSAESVRAGSGAPNYDLMLIIILLSEKHFGTPDVCLRATRRTLNF